MTTLTRSASTVTVPTVGTVWWADETGWEPLAQSQTRVFGGAVVIQEAALSLAGRPLTLRGGEPFAVLSQSDLAALLALGDTAGAQITATLDDARGYLCTPRRTEGRWVLARPMPEGGPDSPVLPIGSGTRWWLDEVRLTILSAVVQAP